MVAASTGVHACMIIAYVTVAVLWESECYWLSKLQSRCEV